MRKNLLLIILCCLFSISFAGNVVPVQDAKMVCKNYLNSVQKAQRFELSDFTLQHTEYDENGEALYYRFSIAGEGFVIVSATESMIPVLAYSTESDFVAHEGVNFILNSYKKSIVSAKQATDDPVAKIEWNRLKRAPKGIVSDTFLMAEHEPIVTSKWNQSKFFNFFCPADAGASASQHPDFDYDDHVPVGCVAVNMASIMYYYRYPEVGNRGVSYRPVHVEYDQNYNPIDTTVYPRQTAEFCTSYYNYNAMNDKAVNYNGEVAKLLSHSGISILMDYSADGSAASSLTALESMKTYWKYSQNAGIVAKADLSGNQVAQWAGLIMNEIDSMRPVYYSASDGMGHAFLLDGYKAYDIVNTITTPINYVRDTTITEREVIDTIWTIDTTETYVQNPETGLMDTILVFDTTMTTNQYLVWDTTIAVIATDTLVTIDTTSYTESGEVFVHVNWGWGGASNGYFALNGGGHLAGYTEHEQMFTGLMPSEDLTKPISDTTRIIATAGSISDGAGNQKYQPNTHRTWIVSAPEATSYTFTFSKLKTEQNGDVISFYNAANPTTALRSFSGVYAFGETPDAFTINADSVMIIFKTNSNEVTDYGFVIDFTADGRPGAYCSSTNVLSDGEGVISDKGANYQDFEEDTPYRPESFCRWTINPTNLSRTYISVTKFELGLGDVVDIFDIYHSADHPTLLKRFDMFNNFPSDGVYALDAGRIRVQFVSDNYDENNGFQMTYQNVCGINENNGLNVNVYPNPVSNNLYIELNDELQGQMNFKVIDMSGKVVLAESVDSFSSLHSINVSNLAKGMYMLNIESKQGNTIRKFIVE